MKKKSIKIIWSIIFLLLLVSSLYLINLILTPKYTYSNSQWPTTATFNGFYNMDKDSVDVIFLGSSVAASAFNPQEIYDYNGIRSYNLASEQQSLFLSYYWLKEAFNYQSPGAVVADMKFLFITHPESPINTSEPITRKCLDAMRFSPVKKEAVKELCAMDKSQTELSYYLTNIRFHSRWSELEEQDFTPSDYNFSPLKGYAPLGDKGPREFIPMERQGTDTCVPCDPLMLECLNRIYALCKEHDSQLILTYMAESNFNESYHNTMQKYADEHGIRLYNFSDKELYEKVGAKLRDESIIEHANLWGSAKLSRFLADELSRDYGIKGTKDEQWESSRTYYHHVKKSCELSRIDEYPEFFEKINDPDYTTFIVVRNDASRLITPELMEGMLSVGLSDIEEYENESYCAVISPGNETIEKHSNEPISLSGSIRNGRSIYSITSAGFNAGNYCSLSIDGKDIINGEMGIQIAVYDNVLEKIVNIRDI